MSDLNLEGLSDKQLMLFTVRCARRVQHLIRDPGSIAALDVAERYAHGEATDKELADAANAAWAAANAAGAAARAAGAAGAGRDAAMDAALAARSAAMDAAGAAALAAELAEQQKILDEIRNEAQK